MADVITFPRSAEDRESDRLRALIARVGLDEAALRLGNSEEWAWSAISYLKTQVSGRQAGSVGVSVAAIHLVLEYVEGLAALLDRIPSPDGPGAA